MSKMVGGVSQVKKMSKETHGISSKYLAVFLRLVSLLLTVQGFSVVKQQYRTTSIISGTDTTSMRSKTRPFSLLVVKENDSIVDMDPSNNNNSNRRGAPNKRTALRWVVESIERLGGNDDDDDAEFSLDQPSAQLLDALRRLLQAKTQSEVAEAGRLLESLNISKRESIDVQERVIKATAMSGLLKLATHLLDGFLVDKGILPSPMAYVAVCNGLRQAGRVKNLEQLIYKLGRVADQEHPVSVVALNTYLAALCQNIQDPCRLENARDWLRPGVSTERLGGTEPDTASYSTVLHAAASMENRRMVDELWEEMTVTRQLQPTIYAYNARLRASARGGPDGHAEILDLWDNLQTSVEPDRYTIDLLLVPLIRAKRIGNVESLLTTFVESGCVDARTASNAFAAFLNTLVKAGELSTARAIFDTYLLSSEQSSVNVQPNVRHFNSLIDGYRRIEESNQGRTDDQDDESIEESLIGPLSHDTKNDVIREARESGYALYDIMLDAGVVPDCYTLTSMLGLTSTPEQVTDIFKEIVFENLVQATPAVLRATIIAYGHVSDVASACIVFDEYSAGTTSIRTWNALLQALAMGAARNLPNKISIDSSSSAYSLVRSSNTDVTEQGVCKVVNGKSCHDGIQGVLRVMDQRGDHGVGVSRAPPPNSQTYCIATSALQHGASNRAEAMRLFQKATALDLAADGRFINALFRCFGDDIDGALSAWKSEIRRACLAHEHRRRPIPPTNRRAKGKNLIASYHGLLYVCGRALRPDVAVRLVYAMGKDALEPNETALNCYRSGKRMREKLMKKGVYEEKRGLGRSMSQQFESILEIECSKFNQNDKRRAGERRVRIII